jgi:cytochrome c nitrite reductase small subunit
MSDRWPLIGGVLGLALGIPAGLGLFTFIYADGASYMTDNPAACANCHVMQDHFDAWAKSSHSAVAVCNDCHTPANFVGKYTTKAINGYHHSMAFTLGGFHEPFQITPRNLEITEAACRRCHADVVHAIDTRPPPGEPMSCVRCHFRVGHPLK